MINTQPFEAEEGGCRQRSSSMLWFAESFSCIVVLATSLTLKM